MRYELTDYEWATIKPMQPCTGYGYALMSPRPRAKSHLLTESHAIPSVDDLL